VICGNELDAECGTMSTMVGRPSRRAVLVTLALVAASSLLGCGSKRVGDLVVDRDVPIAMRDGVVLRANVWRPPGGGPFPVLVYRTPYGKDETEGWYTTHRSAVNRGYAVVLQDVRGRHASDGEFDPYRNEGLDGYDTIEWAARQPWSLGRVGTYGLSYPGAVQWLAAVERPPHLLAMVPAMTFSTPSRFFYFGGVFDLSWLAWIHNSIAPDTRRRYGLPGPTTSAAARETWQLDGDEIRSRLPLRDMPVLEGVAPYYFRWLEHEPTDPWWNGSDVRSRYSQVDAAVLNLSGWYDEAYGPEGATTNFNGLLAARRGDADPRTRLVIGPWVHGVGAIGQTRTGDLDFGPAAAVDYDALVLDWMDRYLRQLPGSSAPAKPVQIFVMSDNIWRDEESWPPVGVEQRSLFLAGADGEVAGALVDTAPSSQTAAPTVIASDPADPVVDPYPDFGPHDYRALADREDVLVFDTLPLDDDCDCPDTDLWARLLDLAPDRSAHNLMSPGSEVLRASYRDPSEGRQLLEPGHVYRLEIDTLLTSHVFRRGHRIRLQLSTSFFPHFSRNLHTGELETVSAAMRRASVTVHHDAEHPSRLLLPVVPR
jgi:putative CocE/NonD family hydrolase